MKLTDVELSAILSEAEGRGLCWGNGVPGTEHPCCPGAVLANVDDMSDGFYWDSQRAKDVSLASSPDGKPVSPRYWDTKGATKALSWMRAAGLV